MLTFEFIAPDVLKIVAPEKLKSDDFAKIGPEVDETLKRYGKISLLIDATRLEGWDTMAAFEKHVAFVKDHESNVVRLAVVVQHPWQHWLVGAVRVFVHPQVRVFDKAQQDDALRWIVG